MENVAKKEGAYNALPIEPQKGRWLVDKSHGYFGIYCSNCDTRYPVDVGAEEYKHCPNCGIEMDLGGRVIGCR
jgi:PHP family Zn ribbon phosphoesterase